MFGVTIDWATNVYFDNEAMYKNISIPVPESVLKKALFNSVSLMPWSCCGSKSTRVEAN